jgi:hypothetical protein
LPTACIGKIVESSKKQLQTYEIWTRFEPYYFVTTKKFIYIGVSSKHQKSNKISHKKLKFENNSLKTKREDLLCQIFSEITRLFVHRPFKKVKEEIMIFLL